MCKAVACVGQLGAKPVPFPPLGALRPSRGGPGPGGTSPAPVGGFCSFPLLLAPPTSPPSQERGGHRGNEEVASAAMQLLICMSAFPRAPSHAPAPASGAPDRWVQLGGVAQQHMVGWKPAAALQGFVFP